MKSDDDCIAASNRPILEAQTEATIVDLWADLETFTTNQYQLAFVVKKAALKI